MDSLNDLGISMVGYFSDFWTYLTETKLKDISTVFPDSIENISLSSAILGAVVTAYIIWVLVKWVADTIT